MKNLILLFFISFCCIGTLAAKSDSIILALEDTLLVQIDSFGEEHLDVAQTHDDLAKRYEELGNYSGDYSQALEQYKIALEIRREILGENHLDVAQTYYDFARVHTRLGNQERAIELSEKALKIRRDQLGNNHPDVAIIQGGIGSNYLISGNYAKALELYNEALKALTDKLGKHHSKVLNIQANMANAHRALGNYTDALKLYNHVLKFWKSSLGENHFRVGYLYKNMGNVYLGLGNYTKALERYNEALKILKNELEDKHYEITNTQYNIAVAHLRLNNYAKALKLSDKVLEMRRQQLGEKHPSVADSYGHRSLIYMGLKDYEEAIELNKKALAIWRDTLGKNHPNLSYSYINLALIYYKLGNYEEALTSNEKALKIQIDKLGKNHPTVIKSYVNKAKTYQALNKRDSAAYIWEDTIINQSLKRLNDTYLFLPDNQRLEYAKTFKDVYNGFYSFAAKHGDEDTKKLAAYLLFNTKSLALDYSISVRKLTNNIGDEELKNLHNELNTINRNISQAELMTDEELTKKDSVLTNLRNQQDFLTHRLLENKTLREKLYKTPIKWEDAQNKLKSDEALLDFVHFYEESDSTWMYYAMLTRKDMSAPQFIRITDHGAIIALLKSDDEYGQPNYIQTEQSRKDLYQKIWQPLTDSLKGIKTVHLSPSGLLHRIDFGVLQDENENFLDEQGLEFHYYTTMRDFAKKKKTNWLSKLSAWLKKIFKCKKYKNLLLFGDIAYDSPIDTTVIAQVRSGFGSLEFAGKEITEIGIINEEEGGKSTKITGNDVTEDTLRHHVENLPLDILHFATHGLYVPSDNLALTAIQHRLHKIGNPLQRSAIMLSGANNKWKSKEYISHSDNDGILTAYEVSHLDLSKTKLVVLSACETALGDIHDTEGVLGLQSAFKLAGVEHVVVSLWKVDDEATMNLMVAFYENLLEEKQDAPTALRNAKAEMRQDRKEPSEWAGFVLIE